MPEPIDRDEALRLLVPMILEDERTRAVEWDSIALVMRMANGQKGMHGYRFHGDDWAAFLPGSFDVIRLMKRLQTSMAQAEGREWHQALVHLTRTDGGEARIDVEFEYDDPQRWSVGKASLDLASFAESLRPKDRPD